MAMLTATAPKPEQTLEELARIKAPNFRAYGVPEGWFESHPQKPKPLCKATTAAPIKSDNQSTDQ